MSYTYIPAGMTSAAFEAVQRPLYDKLFFAGEAASRQYYGTAHGAYESGLVAAKAVMQAVAKQQQQQQQKQEGERKGPGRQKAVRGRKAHGQWAKSGGRGAGAGSGTPVEAPVVVSKL